MKLSREELTSKDQTGAAMHRLIRMYSGDVRKIMVSNGKTTLPFSELSVQEAFDLVKNIPYRQDNAPIEVISRPSILMRNSNTGLDCKKKSILISSYLHNRGIPYRLIASSKRPDGSIHHVFPQMRFGNRWLNMDATYRHYKPFDKKTVTRAEVLSC